MCSRSMLIPYKLQRFSLSYSRLLIRLFEFFCACLKYSMENTELAPLFEATYHPDPQVREQAEQQLKRVSIAV